MTLIRKGEAAALLRINHLKASNAALERNLALHTASLAAQHELVTDVAARLTALAKVLPHPQKMKPEDAPPWEAVYAAIVQLHHRVQRGASGASSAAARGGVAGVSLQ